MTTLSVAPDNTENEQQVHSNKVKEVPTEKEKNNQREGDEGRKDTRWSDTVITHNEGSRDPNERKPSD